jgi:hypothetical protein
MPLFSDEVHDLLENYHLSTVNITTTRLKRKILRTYTEDIDSSVIRAKTKQVTKRGLGGRLVSTSYKIELFEASPLFTLSSSPELLYPDEYLTAPTSPPPSPTQPSAPSSSVSSNDPRLGPRVDPNNSNIALLGTAESPIDLTEPFALPDDADPYTVYEEEQAIQHWQEAYERLERRQNRPRN